MIDETTAIQEFETWLYNSSLKPSGHVNIQADGQIHRYTVEGDRAGSRNGAYCLHLDGRPAGYVMSWKTGKEEKEIWKYSYSDEERREYAQSQSNPALKAQTEKERLERECRKAEALRHQREKQEQARMMALKEYLNAWPITDPLSEHPYTRSKFEGLGICYRDDGQFRTRYGETSDNVDYSVITNYPPRLCRGTIEGGICKAGELLVPMRNILNGELQTLVRFYAGNMNGGKWPRGYYTGTSPTGAAYIIWPQHAKRGAVYVCEGFSTALALMISFECQYVIFSVGSWQNLHPVCQALRTRLPAGTKIIIAADNDKLDSKGKNAGLDAANECVTSGVADRQIAPDDNGTDWADELRKEFIKNECKR